VRKRYTVPDPDTGFGRFVWGMFAVLAIAMAIAAPKAWWDGELAIARVLAVLAPVSALVAFGLRRMIGRPDSFVIDVAGGTLETRKRDQITSYALAELGELSIHEVTLDRDGPETWYELLASGVGVRLHFTRMRWAAERRARQLSDLLQRAAELDGR
jgi:hypothetical protein